MLPAEGERKHIEILKKKSGKDRFKIGLGLNRLVRKIMEDGIRNQSPHISSDELKNQISLRTKND